MESEDDEFKKECRNAIFESLGEVLKFSLINDKKKIEEI
jgi:hypothetical protein